MSEHIEMKLSEMTTAQLVKIILAALNEMDETSQIDFIAKYIDARTSLSRLGADNPDAFLAEVESFCHDCLNKVYYSDSDDVETFFSENEYSSDYYDDDWDYDEYYSNTEWAETFSRLFRLATMYNLSGDARIGYESTARLLSCLLELQSDDSYLGTDTPMDNISADWNELFTSYYRIIFQHHTDIKQATDIAFQCWLDFGDPCSEGFLANVPNITIAEIAILDGLKNTREWTLQSLCFSLLEKLYAQFGKSFDKASLAKTLLAVNPYFHLFVTEGFYQQEDWRAVIEESQIALIQIPDVALDPMNQFAYRTQKSIRAAIQSMLVDAYENIADFTQAFDSAKHMFFESPGFDLYKRARGLSEKVADAPILMILVEESDQLRISDYARKDLLRTIYSYEGNTQKLLDMALSDKIDLNYYERKYIALSLMYRALGDTAEIGESLAEYLSSAAKQAGIGDMLRLTGDAGHRSDLLLSGAVLLKEIIGFHISAAKRTRYAKAAYYMCILRDIYSNLDLEEGFNSYLQEIMAQNSRRPALRDEMRVVYAKGTDRRK